MGDTPAGRFDRQQRMQNLRGARRQIIDPDRFDSPCGEDGSPCPASFEATRERPRARQSPRLFGNPGRTGRGAPANQSLFLDDESPQARRRLFDSEDDDSPTLARPLPATPSSCAATCPGSSPYEASPYEGTPQSASSYGSSPYEVATPYEGSPYDATMVGSPYQDATMVEGAGMEVAHMGGPAIGPTPSLQQRGQDVRRFNCKRRIVFENVHEWEMSGADGGPAPGYDAASVAPSAASAASGASQRPPDPKGVGIVYGPLPQHVYVPLWMFYAWENQPELAMSCVNFFFRYLRWQRFDELCGAFQNECQENGIDPDAYKKTVGFAPVWMFVLNVLTTKRELDRELFNANIKEFFTNGHFPKLETMPEVLQHTCYRMKVSDHHYYVPGARKKPQ